MHDKEPVGEIHYFAILVPGGLYGLAFVAHTILPPPPWIKEPPQDIFSAVWMTSQNRGRMWAQTLEDAWIFLHETFREGVEFREVAPARYRQFLSKLRPSRQVELPPFQHGAYTFPDGTVVRVIRHGEAPPRVGVTPSSPKRGHPSRAQLPSPPPFTPPEEMPPEEMLPPPPLPPPSIRAAIAKCVVQRRIAKEALVPQPPPPPPLPPPPPVYVPDLPVFDIDSLPQTRGVERVSFPRKRRR